MASFIILKFKKKASKAAYKELVNRTVSATTVSPRSRARATAPRSSAAISKTSDARGQSLKLTVKTAPSKLREVMRANEVESLHDTLGGGQVLDGPRRRRNAPPARVSSRAADRPKYTEYGESDLEEDEEGDDRDHDRDQDEEMDDDAGSEDEDIEMEDSPMPPKAPKITLKAPAKSSARPAAPKLLVTPATLGNIKSVEDQEMQDDPGDEEVDDSSDLSDDDEDDDDEEEEEEEGDQTNLLEEDAPGEEDEMGNEEDAPGEDDDLEDDSDDDSDETPASGAATPDPAKLTKRQRNAMEGGEFMALEMGPQQRKVTILWKAMYLRWTDLECVVLHRC